jgi:tRNA(Ile)-lysidine synthase
MAARRLRHQFLVRAARKLGSRKIALAHHADDQVELFLLRLLRGSGMDGLAGMKWRGPSPESSRITLARPLLGVTRRDIEAFARKEAVPFRHDASNDSLDILRNRVRHELLPLIEKQYQPGFRKIVLRLMDLLAAETQFSSTIIGELLAAGPERFDKLPVAAQRRLLQLQLIRLGLRHDYRTVELLRNQADRPVPLDPAVVAYRDAGGCVHRKGVERIKFNGRQKLVDLDGTGTTRFDGVRFDWKTTKSMANGREQAASGVEWFDADRIGPRVVLRHWQPGDRFQPIGMGATVKLQDFFANAKVPRAVRHELIVATTEQGEIFWVENMRISERFKLDAGTRHRLEWGWKRPQGRLQRGSKDANLHR